MSEQRAPLTEIRYRQLFAWLLLFRCAKSAADPKKVFVSIVGLVLVAAGWVGINRLFGPLYVQDAADPQSELYPTLALPWGKGGLLERIWLTYGDPQQQQLPLDLLPQALDNPVGFARRVAFQWDVVLTPFRELMAPFVPIFHGRYPETKLRVAPFAWMLPGTDWIVIDAGYVFHVLALAIWTVLVWGYFGGIVARIAAMALGRDERVTLREAITFCNKYIPSYASAPFWPLVVVAVVAFICMIGGWLANIPYFGPLFAGALWILPLVGGIAIMFVCLGLAIGWPLMVPTISVEGTDAFDAVSRAYAYSLQRPWHYLFYALLVIVLGSIATFITLLLTQFVVYASYWAVNWGMIDQALAQLFAWTPPFFHAMFLGVEDAAQPEGVRAVGAGLIACWVYLAAMYGAAYVYSFFWTAATAVYLLLRRDVDATDLDEIWTEEEEEEFFFETQEQDFGTGEQEKPEQQPATTSAASSTPSPAADTEPSSEAPESGPSPSDSGSGGDSSNPQ